MKYRNGTVSIDRGIESCLKTLNETKPPNSIIAICSASIEYIITGSLRLAIIRRIFAETIPGIETRLQEHSQNHRGKQI